MQKAILIQLLSTDASDRATVFVRIFPDDFSYVRTKSDTVMGLTAEALQRNRAKNHDRGRRV